MSLRGREVEQLRDGLSARYVTLRALREAVEEELKANPNLISVSDSLPGFAFDLVEWAEAQERIVDLARMLGPASSADFVGRPLTQACFPKGLCVLRLTEGKRLTVRGHFSALQRLIYLGFFACIYLTFNKPPNSVAEALGVIVWLAILASLLSVLPIIIFDLMRKRVSVLALTNFTLHPIDGSGFVLRTLRVDKGWRAVIEYRAVEIVRSDVGTRHKALNELWSFAEALDLAMFPVRSRNSRDETLDPEAAKASDLIPPLTASRSPGYLASDEMKVWQSLLVERFPSPQEMKEAARIRLDLRLFHVLNEASNLLDLSYGLLQWASQFGRLDDLRIMLDALPPRAKTPELTEKMLEDVGMKVLKFNSGQRLRLAYHVPWPERIWHIGVGTLFAAMSLGHTFAPPIELDASKIIERGLMLALGVYCVVSLARKPFIEFNFKEHEVNIQRLTGHNSDHASPDRFVFRTQEDKGVWSGTIEYEGLVLAQRSAATREDVHDQLASVASALRFALFPTRIARVAGD